ncbi:S8 family serine peptidase [Streptomyces sp. NPDC045470]|uniref:S8 family serine peptidase n=1 Tax=Streptomyces sp. NPDC045470 TaxID=3155469 RepID=UPI0033F4285D
MSPRPGSGSFCPCSHRSPGHTYRYTSGPSDSTAYVSEVAALPRAKYPQLSAGQIANRLTATAQWPSGPSGGVPDAYYGYGVIRPLDALNKDIPAGPKTGPLAAPQAPAQEQPADGNAQPPWEDNSNAKAALGIAAFSLIALTVIGGIVALVVKKRRTSATARLPAAASGARRTWLLPAAAARRSPAAVRRRTLAAPRPAVAVTRPAEQPGPKTSRCGHRSGRLPAGVACSGLGAGRRTTDPLYGQVPSGRDAVPGRVLGRTVVEPPDNRFGSCFDTLSVQLRVLVLGSSGVAGSAGDEHLREGRDAVPPRAAV